VKSEADSRELELLEVNLSLKYHKDSKRANLERRNTWNQNVRFNLLMSTIGPAPNTAVRLRFGIGLSPVLEINQIAVRSKPIVVQISRRSS
jgi:hypothetical protein